MEIILFICLSLNLYISKDTFWHVLFTLFALIAYSFQIIQVSKALSEEIRRLSTLVDEFNLSFHPEQLVLNVYKKDLHTHVENGLGSNLRTRLSTALTMNIENSKREMTG